MAWHTRVGGLLFFPFSSFSSEDNVLVIQILIASWYKLSSTQMEWLWAPSAHFFLWVGRNNERTWYRMNSSWILEPGGPRGCSARWSLLSTLVSSLCSALSYLVGPTGWIPWPGFKRTQVNKLQTGLTLNYPHEWRAHPIFIATWLWNTLCDLYRTDLPDCFHFAWVNSVSIFNMSADGWRG